MPQLDSLRLDGPAGRASASWKRGRSCSGAPTTTSAWGQHPKVIGALVESATSMGAGGARNIFGANHPLVELEQEIAS